MSETITTQLVGAHFRPPAKALLAVLPAGHPLFLRPEPTNEYDSNAVQVVLRTASLPKEAHFLEELETQLAGQGFDLESIMDTPEWHLGYLPRAAKGNAKLEEWNVQVQCALHEVLMNHPRHNNEDLPCAPASLSFDASGKPALLIPWPPVAEGD